jgi:WD40-like Beta Propeller Repeat
MKCRATQSVVAALAAAIVAASVATIAVAAEYSGWSQAVRVEAIPGTDPSFNGAALDGCPFVSRDGKTFYMASNRPGGLGGIDIWVSTRESVNDAWGAPVNVGAPVNSPANDFCPTIARDGHLFYFVSNRAGGCGGDDIYVTRLQPDGWDTPENLGCQVNSPANEASPFPLPERGSGPVLYFSSNRLGGFAADPIGATVGDSDLYVSESHEGVFGPAQLVPGANSAAEDGQPNVRRDGLELFFFSTRPGTLGMADIYSATRTSTSDAWSTPINLGPNVNSAAAETRPSLSWDGTTLYFGSTRAGGEGSTDIYVTTRERLTGNAR